MHVLLIRWAIVVVFFVATFWPNWGLLFQAINYFPQNPMIVLSSIMIWTIPASLFLPLSRTQFQMATSVAIVGLYFTIAWMIFPSVDFFVNNIIPVLVIIGGVLVGWWMVSTRVWRQARGIIATDDGQDPVV